MHLRKFFTWSFWKMNHKASQNMIAYDYKVNAAFRGVSSLPRSFLHGFEWRTIVAYRRFQANINTVWKKVFLRRLERMERRTGIRFEQNKSFGAGLIIGHWGNIVVNGEAQFGSMTFVTHGITIGRDIRGKRKGVPSFGDRVCIRSNSTVVGNVKIGNDVLIAPNTFVNFDVPDHSVVVGSPGVIHHRDNATEGHIPIV